MFATDIFGIGRGRPVFVYNMLDLERFRWRGSALGEGKHTIVFDFKYDGPGVGKGGTGVLTVDGKEVERKTMEHTIPFLCRPTRVSTSGSTLVRRWTLPMNVLSALPEASTS